MRVLLTTNQRKYPYIQHYWYDLWPVMEDEYCEDYCNTVARGGGQKNRKRKVAVVFKEERGRSAVLAKRSRKKKKKGTKTIEIKFDLIWFPIMLIK